MTSLYICVEDNCVYNVTRVNIKRTEHKHSIDVYLQADIFGVFLPLTSFT